MEDFKDLIAKSPVLQRFTAGLAEGYYRLFWKECGMHGLSIDQKVDLLCRLRDFGLQVAYWELGEDDTLGKDLQGGKKTLGQLFPELIPQNLCKKHTGHLTKLSGLMLYVEHMELAKEVLAMAREGKLTEEQIRRIRQ